MRKIPMPAWCVLIVVWIAVSGCTLIRNDVYERTNPLHRQGKIDLAMGKNAEAQTVLAEAIAQWPAERRECPELAAIYNNMGRSLAAQGDHVGAVTYYRKGMDIFLNADPKKKPCVHPVFAVLRNNMCESQVNLMESVPQDSQSARYECLAAFEANMNLPGDYFALLAPEDIAWGLWNWGGPCRNSRTGSPDCAGMLSKVEHPRLSEGRKADVLFELGHLAMLKSHLGSAEVFHREALIKRVAALGVWDPKSSASVTALMLSRGLYSEAIEYRQAALTVNSTEWDQLAFSKLALGLALDNETSLPQVAYDLYAQAFKSCKPADPSKPCAGLAAASQPDKIAVLSARCVTEMEQRARLAALSLHGMARTLKKINPEAQVDPLYRMALALREATFGAQHPITLQSHLSIAQTLEAAPQSRDQAEQFYEAALKIAEVAYGPKDELVGAIYADLGRVRQTQGHTASAIQCFKMACEILPGLQPDELMQRVRAVESMYDRSCFMEQLQGAGARTVIARDPPHLPRDHSTAYEYLKKKGKEFAHLLDSTDLESVLHKLGNIFDDPFDDVKHKLHGSDILGWRILLHMDGANDPCMEMDREEIRAENL